MIVPSKNLFTTLFSFLCLSFTGCTGAKANLCHSDGSSLGYCQADQQLRRASLSTQDYLGTSSPLNQPFPYALIPGKVHLWISLENPAKPISEIHFTKVRDFYFRAGLSPPQLLI